MKVQLQPFDFAAAVARAGMRSSVNATTAPDATHAAASASAPTPSFKVSMSKALEAVSRQQQESQRLQRELQLDNPAVSLEETMVAMQKANIGFQGALAVRNRLVQAYTEIMNMPV